MVEAVDWLIGHPCNYIYVYYDIYIYIYMYMYAFVLSTLGPWVDLWKASYTSKQFGSFHLAYIVPFLQWLDLAAVSPVYGICHLYSHISGNVSKQGPETF